MKDIEFLKSVYEDLCKYFDIVENSTQQEMLCVLLYVLLRYGGKSAKDIFEIFEEGEKKNYERLISVIRNL